MKKLLSRNVIVDGFNKGLSIVEISNDGHIEVRPFENEEAGVEYTDLTIVAEIKQKPHKLRLINNKDNPYRK